MRWIRVANSTYLSFCIDDEDYDRCKLFNWWITDGQIKTKIREDAVPIANYIKQNYLDMFDHRDRNFLNNQKSNLRICTPSQNGANKAKYLKTATSKYKGVSYCHRDNCWRAYIKINQKSIALGTFKSEEAAARAYNKAALKYFQEFAVINENL